jgi:hypothetical protein
LLQMKTNLPSHSVDGFQFAHPWFRALSAAIITATLFCPAVAQSQSQSKDWPRQENADTIALRSSSSPAEKKLSFNLLLLTRQVRKAPLGPFASMLDTSEVNPDGTVTVDIIAYLSPSLMASPVMANVVRVNGAIPLPAYVSDHLRAKVYKWQLLDLAANPNVLSIHDVNTAANDPSMAANTPPPVIPATR